MLRGSLASGIRTRSRCGGPSAVRTPYPVMPAAVSPAKMAAPRASSSRRPGSMPPGDRRRRPPGDSAGAVGRRSAWVPGSLATPGSAAVTRAGSAAGDRRRPRRPGGWRGPAAQPQLRAEHRDLQHEQRDQQVEHQREPEEAPGQSSRWPARLPIIVAGTDSASSRIARPPTPPGPGPAAGGVPDQPLPQVQVDRRDDQQHGGQEPERTRTAVPIPQPPANGGSTSTVAPGRQRRPTIMAGQPVDQETGRLEHGGQPLAVPRR